MDLLDRTHDADEAPFVGRTRYAAQLERRSGSATAEKADRTLADSRRTVRARGDAVDGDARSHRRSGRPVREVDLDRGCRILDDDPPSARIEKRRSGGHRGL